MIIFCAWPGLGCHLLVRCFYMTLTLNDRMPDGHLISILVTCFDVSTILQPHHITAIFLPIYLIFNRTLKTFIKEDQKPDTPLFSQLYKNTRTESVR